VPLVVRVMKGGGCFPDSEMECDEGVHAKAFVMCHECGAHGPAADDVCYSREDCDFIEELAVAMWQDRTAKHRHLYDAGEAEGLNEYPRADE
jgi:hypothetical protein